VSGGTACNVMESPVGKRKRTRTDGCAVTAPAASAASNAMDDDDDMDGCKDGGVTLTVAVAAGGEARGETE